MIFIFETKRNLDEFTQEDYLKVSVFFYEA